jgi:RNA polymerase sigma-70 factor (ECF subfamily)
MTQATLLIPESLQGAPKVAESNVSADRRVAGLVEEHYDFIWRTLRRLGVGQGDSDDAAQQVFLIASRKIASIRRNSERSFLFQTALRVASDHRRARRRRRESGTFDMALMPELADPAPLTDEVIELRRARATLDRILDTMSLELRAVFILHELDEMSAPSIAAMLGVPVGTVASRLRRARCTFFEEVERLSSDLELGEGGP